MITTFARLTNVDADAAGDTKPTAMRPASRATAARRRNRGSDACGRPRTWAVRGWGVVHRERLLEGVEGQSRDGPAVHGPFGRTLVRNVADQCGTASSEGVARTHQGERRLEPAETARAAADGDGQALMRATRSVSEGFARSRSDRMGRRSDVPATSGHDTA